MTDLDQETASVRGTETRALRKIKTRLAVFNGSRLLLTTAITAIWGLFVLFIVFSYTDFRNKSDDVTDSENSSVIVRNQSCLQESYTGEVCRGVLGSYQECLSDGVIQFNEIFISLSSGNQGDLEEQVINLLDALRLLDPSLECKDAALQFLCRYAFPICDSSGEFYLPSSGECTDITSNTCAREWETAVSFLPTEQLPQCDSLPVRVQSIQCNFGSGGSSSRDTNSSNNVVCSEGFYQDGNSGLCIPACGEWQLYSNDLDTGIMFLTIVLTSVGIFFGMFVLAIACFRHKTMLKFPNSLIVYQTASALLICMTVLMSYIGNEALFCTSKNLIKSFMNPSPYCTYSGVVFLYMYWQIAVWWLLHLLALFWGIRFPLRARAFKASGKERYMHITAIVLGLIFPWLPVASVLATGGFRFGTFPPILCIASNGDALYYSTQLPSALLETAGLCLLLVIFFTLVKEYQKKHSSQSLKPKRTPEVKVLIIVSYYLGLVIFAVVVLIVRVQIWPKRRFTEALAWSATLCVR